MSAKDRAKVGTYRQVGTFRAQHAEKTGRAAQRTPLPPRCEHCQLWGRFPIKIDGITHFYCADHVPLGEGNAV